MEAEYAELKSSWVTYNNNNTEGPQKWPVWDKEITGRTST